MKTMLKIQAFALAMLVNGLSLASEAQLIGAGSTLTASYYNQIIAGYAATYPSAMPVVYNGIGSDAGIVALKEETVNFVGTDLVLTKAQLDLFSHPILTLPIAAIGVAIAYNLPGNPEITLNASQLADIFNGTVTNWNQLIDASFDIPIVVVARSDASGTTGVFTDFLSKSNIGWPANLTGTQVTFPAPLQVTVGSTLASIQSLEGNIGAIGYVNFGSITPSSSLAIASIVNSSGNSILPSVESIAAAETDIVVNKNLQINAINSSDPAAYPITNFTFLVVNQNQSTINLYANLRLFLTYIATQGQQFAQSNGFAPLTPAIIAQYLSNLNLLTVTGYSNLSALLYYKYCFVF